MIRSYCFYTEKYPDEGLHLLLFAIRESEQESLGFTPFELVFLLHYLWTFITFKKRDFSHKKTFP